MIKVLSLVLIIAALAFGNIYWVSSTGTAAWANAKSATPLSGTSCCSLGTANANLQAGDTVYLRGGVPYLYTGLNDEALAPTNSGSAGPPIVWITIKNAPGEAPEIRGTAGVRQWGLRLEGNSYVKIDGIKFTYFSDMALIRAGAHHVEVTNCTFQDGGTFWMVEACIGGGSYVCPVTDIWVHHNIFSRNARGSCSGNIYSEGGDALRVGYPNPTGNSVGGNTNITIEDNLLEYAGHTTLDTYGKNLVINRNVFHNEPWYPDPVCGTPNFPSTGYTIPVYDGYYGHRNWQMTYWDSSGTWNLAEGNRSGHASVNPNNDGADNFDIASDNNIVRFNSFYNAMNNGVMFKYGPYQGGGSYNRFYNNTVYNNGYGYPYYGTCPLSTCPEPRLGTRFYYGDGSSPCPPFCADTGNVIKNNIVYNNYDDIMASQENTIVHNWVTTDGNPNFVNPDLTQTSSKTLPDLNLQSSSPAIDGGTYLTTANGSGNSVTTLIVRDAQYFQDGTWGASMTHCVTLFPDWIAIGSINNVVQISSINYTTNTITLASPMSWSNNAPIWLYKKSDGAIVLYGTAPDYGAHEYFQTSAVNQSYHKVNLIKNMDNSNYRMYDLQGRLIINGLTRLSPKAKTTGVFIITDSRNMVKAKIVQTK
jgi:hypothetical protein